VTILDNTTNEITSYKSLRAAAKALGTTHGHLAKFDGKVFKNRYEVRLAK
jgi:hypothetical protein